MPNGYPSKILHIISHTHWDREWYLTFQQFCLTLVHLVDGLLARLAKSFAIPQRVVTSPCHPGNLPTHGTILACTPPEFQVTAIKTCEDGQGWLAHGVNLEAEPIGVALQPWRRFERAVRTNLAEEALEELTVEADGTVRFEAGGHQVLSVRFFQKSTPYLFPFFRARISP